MTSPMPLRTAAILVAVAAFGCGELEPEPPVDGDGEPIDVPAPMEEWLFFSDVRPAETLSVEPTIEFEFNEYVAPDTFSTLGAVRLVSGGLEWSGRVDYRMSRKTVVFEPTRPLEPGLRYHLRWNADDVRSVTGSPLHPLALLPTYTVDEDSDSEVAPLARPEVVWEDVEPIFEHHCSGCHGDDAWQLPPMERDALVRTRSEQVDYRLVEPYHPARSYLMHKILPDYPERRFTHQPPPYSDAPPLSDEDIERIEHWIAGGASR